MPDTSIQKWPFYVAIAGIIFGALGTGFGVWMNSHAQERIAEIQAAASLSEAAATHAWSSNADRCQQLSNISEKLAENRAAMFSNLKLDKRADMEGFIWAGASYLSQDSQKPFLERYKQGRAPSDEYGIDFVRDLSDIVLQSLAKEAAICRQSLVQSSSNG